MWRLRRSNRDTPPEREDPSPTGPVPSQANSSFVFEGLRPWGVDSGIVECHVGEWVIDLHNCARFRGYAFSAEGMLTLTWYHHQPTIGPDEPHLVTAEFADVRNFVATQAEDWDVRCSKDTHGWDYWPLEDGRAQLSYDVADSELEFTASGVHLRLIPTAPMDPIC